MATELRQCRCGANDRPAFRDVLGHRTYSGVYSSSNWRARSGGGSAPAKSFDSLATKKRSPHNFRLSSSAGRKKRRTSSTACRQSTAAILLARVSSSHAASTLSEASFLEAVVKTPVGAVARRRSVRDGTPDRRLATAPTESASKLTRFLRPLLNDLDHRRAPLASASDAVLRSRAACS